MVSVQLLFEQGLTNWHGEQETPMPIIRTIPPASRIERLARLRQAFRFPTGTPLLTPAAEPVSQTAPRELVATYWWRAIGSRFYALDELSAVWTGEGFRAATIDEAADYEAAYRHLRRLGTVFGPLPELTFAGTHGPDYDEKPTIPVRVDRDPVADLRFDEQADAIFDHGTTFLLVDTCPEQRHVQLAPNLQQDPFFRIEDLAVGRRETAND